MIPLLALGLYLLGLLLAFGVRSLTQWRRTGDTGAWWTKRSIMVATFAALRSDGV